MNNKILIDEALQRAEDAVMGRDYQKAKDEYYKAIELGSKKALCFLGNLYASQKKLPQLANAYYGKAIEIGEAEGFSPYFMDQLKSSISSLESSIQPPLDYEGFIKFCK